MYNLSKRQLDRINKSEVEAKRFLNKLKELKANGMHSGKNHAALKRSSMDLSRSLTEIRKGEWED